MATACIPARSLESECGTTLIADAIRQSPSVNAWTAARGFSLPVQVHADFTPMRYLPKVKGSQFGEIKWSVP